MLRRHQSRWAGQALYDHLYCQCGEAENCISKAQAGLVAKPESCHVMRSNQLRKLLPAHGYVLGKRLRTLALPGVAPAQVAHVLRQLRFR